MTVTLRDGSQIAIRPLEPDDRAALAEGFERLSPESRYRRFFGPIAQLRERDLDYLTRVDHHDHEALVAVDPETGQGAGVARYVRTAPEVAEPAIVVADDWQGRGLGSRLLDALADRAREEGVRRFEAPVLATNVEAMRALARLGETTRTSQGREVLLHIELRPEPAEREPWRHVLAQFAAGAVEPARTVLELLWPRRAGEPGEARRNVIVVGTDGSDDALAAVETAAGLAALSDASLEIVGAHRFLPTDEEDIAAAVRGAAGMLRERGLHAHEHVRRGDPALVITDVAAQVDARLIVVGAGRGDSARPLIGTTADVVAARSPCDVLIVRPRAG